MGPAQALTGSPAASDAIDRPHPLWWIGILGGLTLLAFQGYHAEFYDWYVGHLNPLPGRTVMQWILIACFPLHVFEAVYAYRLANRLGLHNSALGWGVQTFLLGYPSTHLIRKREKAARGTR